MPISSITGAEKHNIFRHLPNNGGLTGARATPYLSGPAIDRFITGGKRTRISQFFFNKCRTRWRGKSAQKAGEREKTAGRLYRRPDAKGKSNSAAGRPLSRIEDQLLYAPVEDFGDEQHVLGRACDFMDPAELSKLFA